MNSFNAVDPRLFDVPSPEIVKAPYGHSGYTLRMEQEDTRDVVFEACGAAARDFPDALWIEPREWAEFARENDKQHCWGMNYLDRYTMQDPTHECTTHSLRANAEACRNREIGIKFDKGPVKDFRYEESATSGSVWLSCLSIYAEANPGKWGGANVRQVMEIACRRGFLPDKTQPRAYPFKHSLIGTNGKGNSNQSSGNWVPVSKFPNGWQETAKLFKPREVIFPASWEQAVCLVLHRMLCSVGRDGHAVPWAQAMFGAGNQFQGMAYPDSYNVTRYDSANTVKRAWQGSFAIASMTAPDNWDHPEV